MLNSGMFGITPASVNVAPPSFEYAYPFRSGPASKNNGVCWVSLYPTATFDPAIRLGKVGFVVGALTKPELFTAQPRPQRVRFHFFDKSGKKAREDVEKDLEDVGEFRYYNVDAKNVSRLEIEILTVKPSLQGGLNTAIAEIAFFKRT